MAIIGLVILAVIFGMQIFTSKSKFNKSEIFGLSFLILSVLIVFGLSFYGSYQQYVFWSGNDLSKLYLPPYQSIDYFVFYARTRIFNPYIISLLIGILFLLATKALNKKYQERFFERTEPYLLAISMFVVGNPLWLFYLALLLIIYFLMHLAALAWINVPILSRIHDGSAIGTDSNAEQRGKNISANPRSYPRVSAYYIWLPSAFFTILISKWLSALSWWAILKF